MCRCASAPGRQERGEKGVSGPNVAGVHFCRVDDRSRARSVLRTADVMADVANYTNIAPVMQVSEIVG